MTPPIKWIAPITTPLGGGRGYTAPMAYEINATPTPTRTAPRRYNLPHSETAPLFKTPLSLFGSFLTMVYNTRYSAK